MPSDLCNVVAVAQIQIVGKLLIPDIQTVFRKDPIPLFFTIHDVKYGAMDIHAYIIIYLDVAMLAKNTHASEIWSQTMHVKALNQIMFV